VGPGAAYAAAPFTASEAGMTAPVPVEAAGGLPAVAPTAGADAGQLPVDDGTAGQPPAEVAPGSGPAPPSVPPDQQSGTDQAATAIGGATQSQPVNVVIQIRINSPGDNGPISQKNTTVAVGGASNGASSAQSATGSTAAPQTGAQQSTTGQNAAGTAAAAQDQPGNTVVSVRDGSPGKNGRVSQTNSADSAGTSDNEAATEQHRSASKPASARKPAGRRNTASGARASTAAAAPPASLHPASIAASSPARTTAAVRDGPPARRAAKSQARPPRRRGAADRVEKAAGFAAAALPHWLHRGVTASPSAFESGHHSGSSSVTLPTIAALLAALLVYASFRWTTAVGAAARASPWRRRR
jgi:hypothetical protein